MDNCYFCGKVFDGINIKKHDEHIIQQAIGGNLKANNILCASCGKELGKEVDEPFNKIFEGISTRLDIKTDRKSNKKAIEGKISDLDRAVLWKDGKVFPVEPFHLYSIDKTKVTIFGSLKKANQYKKKVESEIGNEQYFKENIKPKIIICDNLPGLVEFDFCLDNNFFKKGLAKIAAGFASKYGVKREDMPFILDINKITKKAKIIDDLKIVPFYPLGIIDDLIEIQKHKFAHYPFHNLIIYTTPKNIAGDKCLICYIELFSTFQYYVVLNDNYFGELKYEYYAQNIIKKDDYIFKLGRRCYKERDIILSPLGITEEYMDMKFLNRKDENIDRFKLEEAIIKEETIKQKYKFDFEGYVRNIIESIPNQITMYLKKDVFINLETPIFNEFYNDKFVFCKYSFFDDPDSLIVFYLNYNVFFRSFFCKDIGSDMECFDISSYKVFYLECSVNKLYIDEILNNYNCLFDSGKMGGYCHMKFHNLEDYIQKKSELN